MKKYEDEKISKSITGSTDTYKTTSKGHESSSYGVSVINSNCSTNLK